MRLSQDKLILYHCTYEYWGDKVTLSPRYIKSAEWTEPDIKRICTAPHVLGCMVATTIFPRQRVYVTATPQAYHEPRDVYDAHITDEKWLLRQTKFKLACDINERDYCKLHDFIIANFNECATQSKQYRNYNKLRQFFIDNEYAVKYPNVRWIP